MKLRLDTHAFIWWASEPEMLSKSMLMSLGDEINTPIISAANIWEIQTKHAAGKLDLDIPLEKIVNGYLDKGISILSITEKHVLALETLPDIHRDPFDRILIAQANFENAYLVTKDPSLPSIQSRQFGDLVRR